MFGSDEGKTIALPKLKSLVVNFGSPHDMETTHRGQDWEGSSDDEAPDPAFPYCAGALVNLARNLKQAKICAMLGKVIFTSSIRTILRSDRAERETWAFPSMTLGSHLTTQVYLMRLHNDEEIVMNSLEEVEEFAEGQIWRTAIGGSRLPADVLEAEDGCIERPLPAIAFDKWKHGDHIRRLDADKKRSYWDWDMDTVVVYHRPRLMSFEK